MTPDSPLVDIVLIVLLALALIVGIARGFLATIGFFAGLPMDQQVTFLNATVDGLPDLDKSFDLLLRHWKAGEPDKLAREMNESLEATPQLARVLLTDRNANWAQWIKARLDRPGTVFVAVGAGHLAGSGSVQDQLKALGLQVDRVKK